MEQAAPENVKTCPKCGMVQEPGGICVRCGLVFAKYLAPVSPREAAINSQVTIAPTIPESKASNEADVIVVTEDDGEVDVVKIIALILLVDSTLSLIGKTFAVSDVFSSSAMKKKAGQIYFSTVLSSPTTSATQPQYHLDTSSRLM